MSKNLEKGLEGKIAFNITGKAPRPLGAYSHAVRVGNLLFIAGQGARCPDSGIEQGITMDDDGTVLSYDIETQTHAVMKNLLTVLEEAGLSLEHLVDVSVFLADMKDFPRYNEVYGSYFDFPDPPSRTTVEVARLPGRNFIEIKATAYFPDSIIS